MKLLLDQNLSFKLVSQLGRVFPQARHVRDYDLTYSGDEVIRDFAKNYNFIIVSKDNDFSQRILSV